MARSGFYTNRLRMAEMVRAFESAGFRVNIVTVQRWEAMPTPRKALAREFQHWDTDELLIKTFAVVLVPA